MTTEQSPSGKYTLTIFTLPTRPGCWDKTEGAIARTDGTVITTVKRNYSSFPFLWIEGHPNGHDYLVCGADYQGQTVIELDTGERRDSVPEEAKQGHGFCWIDYRFDQASRVLTVVGCFWAAPSEFRFYDFADPMGTGWPEIDTGREYIQEDTRWPEIGEDGAEIRCFQTETDEDGEPLESGAIASIKTFRRDSLTLTLASEWQSDTEKARIAEQREGARRWAEWLATFKATDPLYLAYLDGITHPTIAPTIEKYESTGVTHDSWCPTWKERETRWCRRLVTGDKSLYYLKPKTGQRATIDLEWAVKTGPIKVGCYLDGGEKEERFFPHSVEGMRAAFAWAVEMADAGMAPQP